MRDTSSASAVNDGETGPATPFRTKYLKMSEGIILKKKHDKESERWSENHFDRITKKL